MESTTVTVTCLQFVLMLFFICGTNAEYPFENYSLPWNDRVNDLVNRLSLEEIKCQLAKGGAGIEGGPAPAIPRLNIGPYQWNEECLRGAAEAGEATAFPQAIGLAASFR